jgi:hypothetical protein
MIQTRSEVNGLMQYKTFQEAYKAVKEDSSIWKISFSLPNGERARLVRDGDKFILDLLDDFDS